MTGGASVCQLPTLWRGIGPKLHGVKWAENSARTFAEAQRLLD